MSRYKVLTCPTQLTLDGEWAFIKSKYIRLFNLSPVNPVFNRPGLYFDRGNQVYWAETPSGEAFSSPRFKEEFDRKLKEVHLPILLWEEVQAIKVLRKRGLCCDELNSIYARDCAIREGIRYSNTLKRRLKLRKINP